MVYPTSTAMELASVNIGKWSSPLETPAQGWQQQMGNSKDALQHGRQGPKFHDNPSTTSATVSKDDTTHQSGNKGAMSMDLKNSDLNVLTINVRGVECNGRLEQVRLLLLKNQVSVAIITEAETTHAYAQTTHMDGFTAFCPPVSVTGPPGKECGVIMMIENNHASSAKLRPDINGIDTVQTVWTELIDQKVLIGGVYRRNRPSEPELEREEFDQLIKQILKAASTGKTILLLGDINLDHMNPDHRKSDMANELLLTIEAANMKHVQTDITWKSDGVFKLCKCATQSNLTLPNNPGKLVFSRAVASLETLASCGCPKGHRTGTIDNVYITQTESATATVLDNGISDHFPVIVNLENKVQQKRSNLTTIWRRDFARIVTSDFEAALDEFDWSPLYDTNDANQAATLIVKNITGALEKVAPLKPITFRADKPKISLKRDTLEAMASRDSARRYGSRTNFKVLRNKVNRLVKRDKINGVLSRLRKNPGSQTAWKEAKTIIGKAKGTKLPDCTNNEDPSKTADHQNEFFVKKVSDLVKSIPQSSQEEKSAEDIPREDKFSEHGQDSKTFSFQFVTAGGVTRIIRGLNNTKAEGVDNIPTEVLKKGVTVLASPIARLCNISLSSGVFPDLFKEALVHPVHKGNGKDHRKPESYRPISILPAISKVLEIIVRDALLEWLEGNDVLPDSQFGFRPNRSVAMALACAQAEWAASKAKGDYVGVMAFDLSAAFDTIDSAPLIEKLRNAGVKGTPLEWLKSYMSGRSQSVVWNNIQSNPLPLSHGVAQGSILGPLLFLVMTADLPEYVTRGTENAKLTSYADDNTLSVTAKSKETLKTELERMAKRMIDYCAMNCLVINSGKTQLLISSKEDFEVKVGDDTIKAKHQICLLGITYDTNFSTAPYLQDLAVQAKTRAGIIYRLSFGIPNHLLKILTNGLLIGKIAAAAPAAIPFKIECDDRASNLAREKINRAIKSAARTITKTSLKDMVSSEKVLQQSGLRSLNEIVAVTSVVMV